MRLIIFIGVAILLTACDINKLPPWKTALMERDCSEEEFEKVKVEAEYCNASTDYFGSYCLGTAMIRNCPVLRGSESK
jgi:hypothetical protein